MKQSFENVCSYLSNVRFENAVLWLSSEAPKLACKQLYKNNLIGGPKNFVKQGILPQQYYNKMQSIENLRQKFNNA